MFQELMKGDGRKRNISSWDNPDLYMYWGWAEVGLVPNKKLGQKILYNKEFNVIIMVLITDTKKANNFSASVCYLG